MRTAVTALIIITLATACNNHSSAGKTISAGNDTSFTIKGTAGGIGKGLAILTYMVDKDVHADTSIINNGNFSFTGKLQQPQEVGITFTNENYNGGISFFAENAPITVKTDTAAQGKPAIEGSAPQKEFEDFKKQVAPVDAQFDQLNKTSHAIFESGKLTKKLSDSLFVINRQLQRERAGIISSFVKANPASVVSAWAISKNMLFEPDTEVLELLFNILDSSNRAGLYGSIIHETILSTKATAIGNTAIVFTQPDTTNKAVSLTAFKGKYVLVDFWASWCGPCRAENPAVVKAYHTYKAKGFDILGVSLDTDKAAWIKAIKKDNLTWTELSDLQGWKSKTVADYGIKGIPFNVLLDKNGIIIAKNLRGAGLENKLKEILQ